MNLWVKTLRQLSIVTVALFFFSCEDETSFLGFQPKQNSRVGRVDIPLNVSSVFTVDSVITDLRPLVSSSSQPQIVDGILVGEYQDPAVGKITAQSFLSVYPTSNSALNTTAVFDSITVQFRLNYYGYGFTGQKKQRIAVHEITGDTLTLYNGHRYYANSTPPAYSVDPLGEATITIHYDSLRKEASSPTNQQDTLLATGRLSDEFGQRIFDAIKAGFTSADQHKLFRSQIKGLALLPGSEPGVLGMNVINSFGQLSQVKIHYHTLNDGGAVADTLMRTLGFEYSSFTRIEADRTGTDLAPLIPYQSAELPSGQRYIQSGAPVVTKLDLSPFYSFADTVENIVIISAELVIDDVVGPEGIPPHNAILLRLMKNDADEFLNNRVGPDRELASNYFALSSASEPYYFVSSEASSAVTLNYDGEGDKFSGFVSLFAQSLFAGKNDQDGVNENRLKFLALTPASPSLNRGISRTMFSGDNVTLRVHYLRANTVTP